MHVLHNFKRPLQSTSQLVRYICHQLKIHHLNGTFNISTHRQACLFTGSAPFVERRALYERKPWLRQRQFTCTLCQIQAQLKVKLYHISVFRKFKLFSCKDKVSFFLGHNVQDPEKVVNLLQIELHVTSLSCHRM